MVDFVVTLEYDDLEELSSVALGFVIVHVALALLVPQTLWAMLTGGPRLAQRRAVR